MTSEELVVKAFDALAALGAPFMVSGSLASNFYGVPRATQDADLVLDLSRLPFDGLAERLANDFDIDSQVGFESVTGSSRLVLHARQGGFDIELFGLTQDAHDLERFARRQFVQSARPPEYPASYAISISLVISTTPLSKWRAQRPR